MMSSHLIGKPNDSGILEDYDFIKSRLRYPLNSFKRILPFIFFAMVLVVLSSIIYGVSPALHTRAFFSMVFISGSTLITTGMGLHRYWRSLFFVRLRASIDAAKNVLLLKEFMQAQHFRFHQPPGHPEVFMISGKENRQSKESEIVVFIAVDKAILVDSHISTSNIFPGSMRRYHEILDMLNIFIDQSSNPIYPART